MLKPPRDIGFKAIKHLMVSMFGCDFDGPHKSCSGDFGKAGSTIAMGFVLCNARIPSRDGAPKAHKECRGVSPLSVSRLFHGSAFSIRTSVLVHNGVVRTTSNILCMHLSFDFDGINNFSKSSNAGCPL
jgi:hypothetical protein